MRITKKGVSSATITLAFLFIVYIYSVGVFSAYSAIFDFNLYELNIPFKAAFFSAPLWYCIIVTLITIGLAYLCRLTHVCTKTTVNEPTKKTAVVWTVLFAISIIMLLQPGISSFLLHLLPYDVGRVIYKPILSTVSQILNTSLSLEVMKDSGVTMQIPVAAANLILHQCLIFICGYFFFSTGFPKFLVTKFTKPIA